MNTEYHSTHHSHIPVDKTKPVCYAQRIGTNWGVMENDGTTERVALLNLQEYQAKAIAAILNAG